jgi:hypothetical protein
MTNPTPATGARHPIAFNPEAMDSWQVTDQLSAFQKADGQVIISCRRSGGSVVVPREVLVVLARGLMAAHVNAGRLPRVDTPANGG